MKRQVPQGLEGRNGEEGVRVYMPKTKFVISGVGLDVLKDGGKYPCAVCRKLWEQTPSSVTSVYTGYTRNAASSLVG